MATRRWSSKAIWMRSGWLPGSIYRVLLFWDRFSVSKPLSQIQRRTLLFLQQASCTPSFGGLGIRRKARGELYEGIYTEKGVPTCLGQIPMEFVRTDPERGHLYRCNPKGCRLAGSMRGGIRHCDTEVWEDPTRNVRLFGAIRRDGPEWEGPLRQAAGHREGVQVDEGVETAGAALCSGAAADHPSRHHVGTGLSSYSAGEAEDGAGRYDAVDGQEGGLADHLEVSSFEDGRQLALAFRRLAALLWQQLVSVEARPDFEAALCEESPLQLFRGGCLLG